ncbi:MAG: hypothetical protein FWD69_15735 [Polyangiaceae bacterium]|nr:hypothetical protein [Polyangiaceae bacterium]
MTRAFRRMLAMAALTTALCAVPNARAQNRVEIEKARAAYLARNYSDAEERLTALVDPHSGLREPGLLSQARMYLAATFIAEGKHDAAHGILETLIVEDPSFEPDPLSFPGDVINTFIDVRANLQERLREAARNAARLEAERKAQAEAARARHEAWLERVKEMAQEDKTIMRNQRLVAFVPFGAGQFQNRQPGLGWLFLSTEAALVAATVATVPMYSYALNRRNEERASGDVDLKAQIYDNRARNIRIVNLSLTGSFVALAVAGILQANIAYISEVTEVKKRPLPPLARLLPTISPVAHEGGGASGLMLGLSGITF